MKLPPSVLVAACSGLTPGGRLDAASRTTSNRLPLLGGLTSGPKNGARVCELPAQLSSRSRASPPAPASALKPPEGWHGSAPVQRSHNRNTQYIMSPQPPSTSPCTPTVVLRTAFVFQRSRLSSAGDFTASTAVLTAAQRRWYAALPCNFGAGSATKSTTEPLRGSLGVALAVTAASLAGPSLPRGVVPAAV